MAFDYCEGLTSITIPESVTTIGYGAFDVCNISDVYCHADPENLSFSLSWADESWQIHVPAIYLDKWKEKNGKYTIIGDIKNSCQQY